MGERVRGRGKLSLFLSHQNMRLIERKNDFWFLKVPLSLRGILGGLLGGYFNPPCPPLVQGGKKSQF
jgi:hypothetical protein